MMMEDLYLDLGVIVIFVLNGEAFVGLAVRGPSSLVFGQIATIILVVSVVMSVSLRLKIIEY